MDTPCLMIDVGVAERNIARFQVLAEKAGLATRPHVKTHKMPYFAHLQCKAGAIGITCQKIGEAEIMADAGIGDILITYNIVGEEKLKRLVALAKRCRLSVTCDSLSVAEGLSQRFAQASMPLTVLVECDTGAGRCGVRTPQEAAALAAAIADLPGLTFGGLMTYPPMVGADRVDGWLRAAVDQLGEVGLPVPVVSTGGTPNLDELGAFSSATEHRAGTYIFNDRSLIARGACSVSDCAAVVVATVVSRPAPGRAIIDAGSKALSSDTLGLEGFGLIREAPDAQIVALSEEHGILDISASQWDPRIGERITIVPNHVCVVVNLIGEAYLRHADGRIELMPVAAKQQIR
ncbi:alanine racemase [Pelagibacterium lentulum]|uniref:Alanine racemase n=1 Tax=Pelagibacterium lentulum TaxID=2029865 RepID=A0A916RPM7_9HYPH|nr:alanine racemase [Pelagibacterium lentulum]GGA62168.1 alanine racemase [Pelagibacterium lentulum]